MTHSLKLLFCTLNHYVSEIVFFLISDKQAENLFCWTPRVELLSISVYGMDAEGLTAGTG